MLRSCGDGAAGACRARPKGEVCRNRPHHVATPAAPATFHPTSPDMPDALLQFLTSGLVGLGWPGLLVVLLVFTQLTIFSVT